MIKYENCPETVWQKKTGKNVEQKILTIDMMQNTKRISLVNFGVYSNYV